MVCGETSAFRRVKGGSYNVPMHILVHIILLYLYIYIYIYVQSFTVIIYDILIGEVKLQDLPNSICE